MLFQMLKLLASLVVSQPFAGTSQRGYPQYVLVHFLTSAGYNLHMHDVFALFLLLLVNVLYWSR